MPRFIDISGTHPIAAAATARQAIGADVYVNALEFGATGDGTTDDTVALQAWLTYIVTNKRQGWLPNGTYKITGTLNAPSGYGWGIHGENRNFAIIKQFTANTPMMKLGDTSASSHSYVLDNFMLAYNSAQPSTNTSANCLTFDGPNVGDTSVAYWCVFQRLRFVNAYYGFKYKSGAFGPWGSKFDMIGMDSMSGGLLDNSGTTGGCPNNTWGRATLSCAGAVGPIFKSWSGYNMTVGCIEFLTADQGPQLITTQAGFAADIGAIKLEVGTYTGANPNLIDFTGDHRVRIGQIDIGGTTSVFQPSSGACYAIKFGSGGGVNSVLDIGSIKLYASASSGVCVALGGGAATSRATVGQVVLSGGWTLQSTANTLTGNYVTVSDWVNGALSGDKGDADYTVSLGDPNVVQFDTAFTAQRTITLPSQTGDNFCAGLYYDLVFDGAINGSNTAVIKHGSTTLRTQTVDKVRLRYMWRRGGNGEWVLVDVTDISGVSYAATAQVNVFTSSGTWTKPSGAVAVRVRCIGAGGGGGAGARGPSGTALSGGGGGSSGGMSEMMFDAADLASTVAVTVGAGGTGATGQTSDGTAGANGGHPSASSLFGDHLRAGPGRGGTGGGLAVAGAGGTGFDYGYALGMNIGVAGGAGSATGAAGAAGNWGGSSGSGGAGGGITTAPAATAGGAGGRSYAANLGGGGAGSGANGSAGTSSTVRGPATGGGGGGGNISGSGYTGGNGGNYGAGGGGGGASLNGSTSGAGGNGADGIVIVTTYF